MSDRDAFRANRDAAKAKMHEKRLEAATYTAAEVKVLTETASKVALEIGRREAFSDAIAYQVHIDGEWVSFHPSDVRVAFVGAEAPGAVPDERCPRCKGYGYIPDFTNWDDYHGEPKPKPCPQCASQPSGAVSDERSGGSA